MEGIVSAWGRILAGYKPALSIEITRECPLRCPGCYAYGDEHLGGELTLRQVRDYKGQALIDGVLALVDQHRPLHVSIVGGEPLVRYRELDTILPALSARGIYTQLVTSAVRDIPKAWADIPRLHISVSIDGLQPEHDARRTPATYDRILKHIAGHRIVVHCTVTPQQVNRPGYLEEFLAFWSAKDEVRKIWMSLYTPQVGEISDERLTADDRRRAVADLMALRLRYPKLDTPDCANCGCMASAGLAAVARHKLWGFIPVGTIFTGSVAIGEFMRRRRERDATPASVPVAVEAEPGESAG